MSPAFLIVAILKANLLAEKKTFSNDLLKKLPGF